MQRAVMNRAVDPKRYFESVTADSDRPEHEPVCLYLETTNRCNLLCTTCPRTYEELEPPADMSWQLFTSIVDQIPRLASAVLHGVGEPMLVKHLPRMVRYLKDRGTYVLFNTNGTVLNEKNGRALIAAGLDELRVSLDAANAKSFLAIRGKDYFARILKNVRAFRALQEREPAIFVDYFDARLLDVPLVTPGDLECAAGRLYARGDGGRRQRRGRDPAGPAVDPDQPLDIGYWRDKCAERRRWHKTEAFRYPPEMNRGGGWCAK